MKLVTLDPHGIRVAKYLTSWESEEGAATTDVRTVAPDANVILTWAAVATTIPSAKAIGHTVKSEKLIP